MIRALCIIYVLLGLTRITFACDGFDYAKGTCINIHEDTFRQGDQIQIYDYGAGTNKEVEVDYIFDNGEEIEVEVLDLETSESRTFYVYKNSGSTVSSTKQKNIGFDPNQPYEVVSPPSGKKKTGGYFDDIDQLTDDSGNLTKSPESKQPVE